MTTIKLKSFDAFGNPGAGEDKYSAVITSPTGETIDVDVKHEGNGVYALSFTPSKTGTYKFQLKLGDENVGEEQTLTVGDAGLDLSKVLFTNVYKRC